MVSSLNSVPANVLERSQSLVLPALTSPDHGKVPGAVVSQDLLALQVQDGHFHSQNCAAPLRACGYTRNGTCFSSSALQEPPSTNLRNRAKTWLLVAWSQLLRAKRTSPQVGNLGAWRWS